VIVVDCSVIVEALIGFPADAQTLALLADEDLHAPSLIDFETASALRGLALARRLRRERLDEAVEHYVNLTIHRHQMADALAEMLAMRDNFTAYDAAYVVLASALDAQLVTADAKLLEADRLGVEVLLWPEH
jgi:predicted nucleic acid-binding protein